MHWRHISDTWVVYHTMFTVQCGRWLWRILSEVGVCVELFEVRQHNLITELVLLLSAYTAYKSHLYYTWADLTNNDMSQAHKIRPRVTVAQGTALAASARAYHLPIGSSCLPLSAQHGAALPHRPAPTGEQRWLPAASTLVVVGQARCSSHRTRDHWWPCVQFNCSSNIEQFTKGSAVRVTGHFSTPPENWTVRAFLQLTPRLSNDFTAAWLTFTFPQLFAVAATVKSIDYNVAMTFILNNNNNKMMM